jgi:ABC-type multidrug transport system fused ATPase/permease subunit
VAPRLGGRRADSLEAGAAAPASDGSGSAEQAVVKDVVNAAEDVLDDISDVDVSMKAQREVVSVPVPVAAVTAPISQVEQVAEEAAIESAVVTVLVTVVRLCLVSIRFVISLVVSLVVFIALPVIAVLVALASEHGVSLSRLN